MPWINLPEPSRLPPLGPARGRRSSGGKEVSRRPVKRLIALALGLLVLVLAIAWIQRKPIAADFTIASSPGAESGYYQSRGSASAPAAGNSSSAIRARPISPPVGRGRAELGLRRPR